MKCSPSLAAISLLVIGLCKAQVGQWQINYQRGPASVFHGEGPLEDENFSVEDRHREVRTEGYTEGMPTFPTSCEEVRRQSSTDLPSGMYKVFQPEKFENDERGFKMAEHEIFCEMDGPGASQKRDLYGDTNQGRETVTYARDCTDIFMYYLAGDKSTRSGVYKIYNPKWYQIGPMGVTLMPIYVYCDMKTSGGGWTTFQRRTDRKLTFYRTYFDYTHGFGAINDDYWLGLRFINMITELRKYSLKIDMTSAAGADSYALYNGFKIGNEVSGFKLTISCYSGNDTYGDRLAYHNGKKFSAYDRDQDSHSSRNCASYHRGGWWYNGCAYSNLNGDMAYSSGNYAVWWGSTSSTYVKTATSMSFRPEHYR